MLGTFEEEWQRIKAAAMRERRHMKLDIVGSYEIDIGQIGQAHGEQDAVAQHRPFWPPGRATRVEEPGQIFGFRGMWRHRLACEKALVVVRAGANNLRTR